MAGDYSLLGTQSVDETHDVADVMENRILLHLLRTVASPIAAQIWCHRTESSLRQRRELMPPGIPALGKAVAEDDERSFTLLGHMQADAVRLDHAMRHLGHRGIHPRCRLWASPAGLGGSGLKRLRESRADGEHAPRPEHVASGKRRVLHRAAPLIVAHPRLRHHRDSRFASRIYDGFPRATIRDNVDGV
jgi:hypothetical protein